MTSPDPNKTEKQPEQNPKNGLADWNNRLEENLEQETHNDPEADAKATDFSKKYGSGDQSDTD